MADTKVGRDEITLEVEPETESGGVNATADAVQTALDGEGGLDLDFRIVNANRVEVPVCSYCGSTNVGQEIWDPGQKYGMEMYRSCYNCGEKT